MRSFFTFLLEAKVWVQFYWKQKKKEKYFRVCHVIVSWREWAGKNKSGIGNDVLGRKGTKSEWKENELKKNNGTGKRKSCGLRGLQSRRRLSPTLFNKVHYIFYNLKLRCDDIFIFFIFMVHSKIYIELRICKLESRTHKLELKTRIYLMNLELDWIWNSR